MYIVFDTETCLFPNCFNENIKSHAISRSLSLSSISENYHLYHFLPRQNSQATKKPHIKKISTQKATAHRGFCKVHDDFFQSLDTKEIRTAKDVILQVYRSLCIIFNEEKSAAISTYDLNSMDAFKKIDIASVRLFLENNGHSNLIPHLDNNSVLEIVQKKMHFLLADSIEDDLMDIEKLFDYLMLIFNYNEDMIIPVGEMQTLTTENMDYIIFYYKTNFQIPVSVNSIHCGKLGDEEIKIFSIIVPYENSNVIIGLVPKKILDGTNIDEKINSYFSSNLRVIEYVESIISTCDGWYIKPSIIDNMTDEKKAVFIQDCMFMNERKLFNEYDMSIFDELKKNISSEEENTLLNNIICNVPQRANYEIRYKNMIEIILKTITEIPSK